MVSNIPFYSGKTIGFGDRVPFSVVVVFLIIFAAVAVEPAVLLFVLFFGYALSGFCVLIYYKLSGKGNPVKKVS
jgi:CDP-diacylglycerol--serine O-phosphatidyltransferase